ncbi:MAG: DUF4147 domain-containing protein [Chloroflexi bacterium]|nr:DUF4147 domain-containing protein [Chloroflexota bacterium]
MIIKNRRTLATTGLRRHILDIIEAGIARVLPPAIIASAVTYDPTRRRLTLGGYTYDLDRGRLFVIGGGKASGFMAEAFERIVPPGGIVAGIVTCKADSHRHRTQKLEIAEAGHPLPDQRGVSAVAKMLALKSRYSLNENDLVVGLISGGGSALLPCPVEGVSLEDKSRVTDLLLRSGAGIHEINAVRKHLSMTKGGRLGLFFSPATVISLIISDVVGNDLDVIGGGVTAPDRSTFADAYSVLSKYNLLPATPVNVLEHLDRGRRGEIPETPKVLPNCFNYIVGDNRLALEAMAMKATELGLNPCLITAEQVGNTNAIAELRASEIMGGKYTGHDVIIIGGETTLQVPPGAGMGGRNQHYCLASMLALQKYAGEWALASVGTDGSDFLPDVAGAIVDNNSLPAANSKGLDLASGLERCDSHTLLKAMGHSLIITGDTGTNVGDVIVYVLK